MIVVVLDTNTLVSGLGWSGPPRVVIDAVLAGELLLVSSPPLLEELDRVLRYPKLARVFAEPDAIMGRVRMVAVIVEPTMTLNVVADEPDNRVLEAAAEARVDAIVTGDGGLLDLGSYDEVPIMSAGEFVRRFLTTNG
ncbi:MAG TPA: putative toxin-antitoxin system toxin component, PIN family [Acidimicrobiales bacterium]|nr:putative toxin-antitoxin system toxin component, PIN family [Acidimicrobiales bacterium]